MVDKEPDFYFIKNKIDALVNIYRNNLDKDALDTIEYFIKHDEYEMGYESLFIELMKINFNPEDIDMESYIETGKMLNLHRESVFDNDFWQRLVKYIE